MWAQVINTILGIWLMAAPGLLGYGSAASDSGHIIGPVIATFAIVSYWEATRTVRKWNYPLAVWLLLAPWILGYENTTAIVSDMVCGVLVFIFASVQGQIEGTYGGGWSSLWNKNPKHLEAIESNSTQQKQ